MSVPPASPPSAATDTTLSAPRTLRGVLLVLIAVTEFAWLDACMRWVGMRVSLPVALLLRYAVQALFMLAWLAWVQRRGAGGPGFRTAHPRFQFVRGTLLLVSSALVFAALRRMPLAEVTAVNMLGPVLVTLLAGWFLHERVRPAQYVLVAVSFVGALVVVRPGSGLFGWAALLPLASACTYALFNLLSGRLAHLESPLTTNFYTGVVGAGWMVAACLLVWVSGHGDVLGRAADMRMIDVLIVLVGALLGTTGHMVLIHAYRHAPTSVLMPYTYFQIPAAALASWVLFRQVPDGWARVGMAIIAGSGALLVWLNVRRLAGER